MTDFETKYRDLVAGVEALADDLVRSSDVELSAGDVGGHNAYRLAARDLRALLASSPAEREAEGLGDWFRRTPESLAMLAEERKALAESEAATPTPVSSGEADPMRCWECGTPEAKCLGIGSTCCETCAHEPSVSSGEAGGLYCAESYDVPTGRRMGRQGAVGMEAARRLVHQLNIEANKGDTTIRYRVRSLTPTHNHATRNGNPTPEVKPPGVCGACDAARPAPVATPITEDGQP